VAVTLPAQCKNLPPDVFIPEKLKKIEKNGDFYKKLKKTWDLRKKRRVFCVKYLKTAYNVKRLF